MDLVFYNAITNEMEIFVPRIDFESRFYFGGGLERLRIEVEILVEKGSHMVFLGALYGDYFID